MLAKISIKCFIEDNNKIKMYHLILLTTHLAGSKTCLLLIPKKAGQKYIFLKIRAALLK